MRLNTCEWPSEDSSRRDSANEPSIPSSLTKYSKVDREISRPADRNGKPVDETICYGKTPLSMDIHRVYNTFCEGEEPFPGKWMVKHYEAFEGGSVSLKQSPVEKVLDMVPVDSAVFGAFAMRRNLFPKEDED